MIVELHDSRSPEFEGVLDLAYRLFPPEVREPDDTLREEVEGRSRLPCRYFVWDEGGVAGFVRFARLTMGVGFIVHIGVAPERQGSGLGRLLLCAAREAMESDVVVAEVEGGTPFEWWCRQGAEIVSETYTQPALRPETRPVPLNLVGLGPWREIPSLTSRFYDEVWGLRESDPLVQRAVTA